MIKLPIQFQIKTSIKTNYFIKKFANQEGVTHATAARMLIMRALVNEFKIVPEELVENGK